MSCYGPDLKASLQVFRGFSGDLSELSMGINRMDSSLLQSPSDGETHLKDVQHYTYVLVAVPPAMPVLSLQLLLCRGCARPLSYR